MSIESIAIFLLGVLLAILLYFSIWVEKEDRKKYEERKRKRAAQLRANLGETGP